MQLCAPSGNRAWGASSRLKHCPANAHLCMSSSRHVCGWCITTGVLRPCCSQPLGWSAATVLWLHCLMTHLHSGAVPACMVESAWQLHCCASCWTLSQPEAELWHYCQSQQLLPAQSCPAAYCCFCTSSCVQLHQFLRSGVAPTQSLPIMLSCISPLLQLSSTAQCGDGVFAAHRGRLAGVQASVAHTLSAVH